MMFKGFLLFAAASFAVVCGQDEIQNFNGVRAALERGLLLQINIEVQDCRVTGPSEITDPLYISMPLRQWQHETVADVGQVIRAEDWYLNSGPPTLSWTTRLVQIFENDLATLTITFGGGGQDTAIYDFECDLGSSARVHSFGDEETGIDNYYTYNELRSALLLGRHVEATAFLDRCVNAADVLPPGTEYVSGFRIENLAILGDATPEERMIFYDSGTYASNGTLASMGEDVVIWPNGTVVIRSGIYENSDGFPLVFFSEFECILADSVQFTSYRRERDASHITYQSIKEAALQGHDVEAIIFTQYCEANLGQLPPSTIAMRRFDQFQLFEAGGPWGPLEYLAFSSYSLDSRGEFISNVVRVFEDNKANVGYSIFNPATGDLAVGELQCDLLTATLFHTINRERRPVNNYNELVDNVLQEGAIYEIEIDFSRCDSGAGMDLASTYGGILWETYISDARGQEGYFYGVSFALTTSPFGGAAWDTAGITVLPDRTVYVEVHLYDFLTGEDLLQGISQGPIVCQMGNQEAVQFFPFP